MDQLLALSGFLSLLLSMIIITGERRLRKVTPWMWLALFGAFYGIRQWMVVLLAAFPKAEALTVAEVIVTVMAFVSLLEFARTGSLFSGRGRVSQWLLVLLAVLAALGALRGPASFHPSLRLALGMPAGLWAAWTFWLAGHRGKELTPLDSAWVAAAMVLFGLVQGLLGLFPELSAVRALRQPAGLHWAPTLMLGVNCAVLVVLVVILWRHAFGGFRPAVSTEATKSAPHFQGILLLGLLGVLVGGAIATELAGALEVRGQRKQLLDKAGTVALSLDRAELRSLATASNPSNSPAFGPLLKQCKALVNVSERPCYIYLMAKKGNDIIFLLDTEPEPKSPPRLRPTMDKPTAQPGEVYDDAPTGLQAVFGSRESMTLGPYTDKWGTYMSGFVRASESGSRTPCVVGFDVDASDWESIITRVRLVPILITLFVAGLLSMFVVVRERDVAARNRLVVALRDKQAILDAASEVAIIAINPEGMITVFNRGAEKMLGYAPSEVVGCQSLLLFQVEEELAERSRELSRAQEREVKGFEVLVAVARQQGAEQREWSFVRKDGSRFPVSLAVTATRNARGAVSGFLGVAVDLTARKSAERELSEKERFISAVAQTSPDFLIVTSLPGLEPVYCNRQLTDRLGFSPEDAKKLGQNWLEKLIHPQDQIRWQEHLQDLRHAADGEAKTFEYRVRSRDGDYRWLQSRDTVFHRNARGEVVQFLSVAQDVTEMKSAEASKSRLESQLRQAQKLEAVGQLAAGVAHDFNNLLTVIQGNASLLHESTAGEQALYCRQILEASHRAAGLTRQLLLFSRQHLPQRQLLNLGEVIPRISEMLGRLIGEHIRLQWRCDAGLPPVFADPGMIEQVILNLAVNARDAMPHGGHLTLSVEAVTLDAAAAERHPDARAGRFVCLSVADTGSGIEPHIIPRIFDPFFTTKEVGKGTGLGLATAYGIIEQHEGWIEVNSQPGQGTVFRVYLPVTIAPAAAAPETAVGPARRGQGEMVLLVEDEIAVREFAERVLRRGGYQVLVASTAIEALQLWPRHKDHIEVLITDQLMPEGMTGSELARHLRGAKPALRVVLTSGYCSEAADILKSDEVLGEFIAKPFAPDSLLRTVAKALSSGR